MPPANRQIQPSADPAQAALARVWQLAPVGLALLDDGAVEAWNSEARRLLEAAVGGEAAAWQRWLEAAALRLLAQAEASTVLEPRRPGAPALELAVAGQGRPDGPVVVVLREAVAEAARGGGRNLAETVSTLSHELRTPLASMKSSLSLVMGGDAGPLNDDQAHFLGVALRNVSRLDRLVGDLLDIARDDAGRLRIECRPTDLGPLLREALTMFEGGDGRPGPSLDTAGIPEHFRACVDPDKITQIVANLVGNARKYVPPEGRVRVWLDPHPAPLEHPAADLARACGLEARTFTLVVEDNGPGIDPQVVDRVFEPFERGRAEVIGRIGGAGLGLHIVRRLAEAHGGKVSLATAPGAGTTIWVRLPLDPAGGRLLQAAARLRDELAAAGPAGCPRPVLAWLDARQDELPDEARLAAGHAALAALPEGVAGKPGEPAAGLLAVVVRDPRAWLAAGGMAAAGWQLLETGPLPGAGLPMAGAAPATTFGGKPGPGGADNHA